MLGRTGSEYTDSFDDGGRLATVLLSQELTRLVALMQGTSTLQFGDREYTCPGGIQNIGTD